VANGSSSYVRAMSFELVVVVTEALVLDVLNDLKGEKV
jgi:hypothetical protein